MTTGYDILRDIEVEMEKLASAYQVVATELTKRANDEGRGAGTYAGIGAAGAGAGMAAGAGDAYRAARMQGMINPDSIAHEYWLSNKATDVRNNALKSLGKKVAIGAGAAGLGAAGLGVYDYVRNRPVVQDVEGQTKAASLRNLLARLG
jgi:hypothetical protein